jgi:hypothetical protein
MGRLFLFACFISGSSVTYILRMIVYLKSRSKIFSVLKHRAMKMYEGVKVNFYSFLTSVLGGGERSTLAALLWEKIPSTHQTVGAFVEPESALVDDRLYSLQDCYFQVSWPPLRELLVTPIRP